jgi:hypothetical protein
MYKRGQVTIFIIVGILLLVAVAAIFFIKTESQDQIINKELIELPFVSPVQNYIESCLEKTVEEGIIRISRRGGLHDVPIDHSILFVGDSIPYYYEDGNTLLIGSQTIAEELAKYTEENLYVCIDDFVSFEEYTVENADVKAHFILGKSTTVLLDYPITITKGLSVVQMEQISSTIPINIPKMVKVASNIVEEHKENPDSMCLTCLNEWGKKNKVLIEAIPIHDTSGLKNDIILYRILDQDSPTIWNQNYTFEFVVEYETIIEKELEITPIDDISVAINTPISIDIQTNIENVKFEDNSDLFEIKDGTILFTTTTPGYDIVTITATKDDMVDTDIFSIEVTE